MERQMMGLTFNYPKPIIDLKVAGQKARSKVWGHRDNPLVQLERKRIIKTHTRNHAST
jgi:deoxyribodipyrimidine photo-lyase